MSYIILVDSKLNELEEVYESSYWTLNDRLKFESPVKFFRQDSVDIKSINKETGVITISPASLVDIPDRVLVFLSPTVPFSYEASYNFRFLEEQDREILVCKEVVFNFNKSYILLVSVPINSNSTIIGEDPVNETEVRFLLEVFNG